MYPKNSMLERVDSLKSAQQASLNLQSSTVNYIALSYPISVIEILARPTIFLTPFFLNTPYILTFSRWSINKRSTRPPRTKNYRNPVCGVSRVPSLVSSCSTIGWNQPLATFLETSSRDKEAACPFWKRNVTKIN